MFTHLQLRQAVSLPLCPAIAFSVCVSWILSWNDRCSHCVSVSCSWSALFSHCQDLRESLKFQEKGVFRGLVGLVDYRILWDVAGAACLLFLSVYSQSVLLCCWGSLPTGGLPLWLRHMGSGPRVFAPRTCA